MTPTDTPNHHASFDLFYPEAKAKLTWLADQVDQAADPRAPQAFHMLSIGTETTDRGDLTAAAHFTLT